MPEVLQEDLRQISNTLYSPREQELKTRQLLRITRDYDAFADVIGYDVYDRTGSAIVLAAGADAKDIPFVGDNLERFTQQVYTVATGIRFTKSERDAVESRRRRAIGPAPQLDQRRVATARRYCFEKEHKLTFAGDSAVGIKGLFDASFYGANKGTKEDVAEGSFGGTAAQNRLWVNKTPQEILDDLLQAKIVVEDGELFESKVLVISTKAKNRLLKPYSNTSPMTTLKWLATEGMYFNQVITTNVMTSTYNGDSVDYFMVLDNDPEIVELATTQDITLLPAVFDMLQTSKQAVIMKTGGPIVRHPAAFYIGKGV